MRASSYEMARFGTLWARFDPHRTAFLDYKLVGQLLLQVRHHRLQLLDLLCRVRERLSLLSAHGALMRQLGHVVGDLPQLPLERRLARGCQIVCVPDVDQARVRLDRAALELRTQLHGGRLSPLGAQRHVKRLGRRLH